jgi:hypothetical protein
MIYYDVSGVNVHCFIFVSTNLSSVVYTLNVVDAKCAFVETIEGCSVSILWVSCFTCFYNHKVSFILLIIPKLQSYWNAC